MRMMAQKRAEFALNEVLVARKKVDQEKLKHFSAEVPSMILKNGLGQTLAFWLAKGKPEHITLFNIVTKWLQQTDMKNFGDCKEEKHYVRQLSKIEQREYLRNQNEALALLEWVKRFANADLS